MQKHRLKLDQCDAIDKDSIPTSDYNILKLIEANFEGCGICSHKIQ